MAGRRKIVPSILTVLLLVVSFCPFLSVTRAQRVTPGIEGDSEETTYPAVLLQADGVPNTDSYVQWKGRMPSLSTVTLCVRMYLRNARSNLMPILSYSVPEFQDELLIYVDWAMESVVVVCCSGDGRMERQNVITLAVRHTWVPICLALDLQAWRYTLAIDTKIYKGEIITLSGEELVLQGGGILLLGQEQDLHGAGFNVEQSFEGYIADLLIYPQDLRERSVKDYVSCDIRSFDTAVVSFASLESEWEFFGDSEIRNFPKSAICEEPPKIHVMFPEKRTLDETRVLCHMLKGYIAAPESEEENTALVQETKSRVGTCSISWGVYLWLGIRAISVDDTWQYVSLAGNETVPYTNFRHGYTKPVASFHCVLMDALQVGKWVVYPCSFKTCAVCSFTKLTPLRLRGLCEDSLLDRMFIISGMRNEKPVFDGFRHTKIYWDNTTWVIRDVLYDKITGTMEMTDLMQYPLGLRRWNILGDLCQDSEPQLLLTSCRADQYTCNDGTCIRKMQRCDLEVNCPDQSDERLCNPVVVPKDYISEVPPARVGTEPAWINIEVTILSIQPINTLDMKLTLDLSVSLMWRDPRLDMESLNYAETLNVVHDENIWRPKMLFQDLTGTKADTKLQWETFVTVMQSGPDPDDITRVREDEVYPGELNSLKLTQTYWVQVSCQMNLESYPFDEQICSFLMRLKDFTHDLVALRSSGTKVEYRGARNLREYELSYVKMTQSDWNNHSGEAITFRLENLSGFYVSSTYVPTFLMVLICYSTFYFEMDDFNDRIMVSLTALLVLATLFTQITETTPKTSYLKLLDTWFVACILINFSIIILLVLINYLRMLENVDAVVPFNGKRKVVFPVTPERSRKMNTFARIVVPAALCVLIMIYIGVSVPKTV